MAAVLEKYESTIFLCETTEDGRYIRCDFSQCKTHNENKNNVNIPVDYWLLNTEKNVSILEKHVGKEIYEFIQLHEAEISSHQKEWYELNADVLECNSIPLKNYEKLLIVFNLRDPQSSFGRWINAFLDACKNLDGIPVDYTCITLSFSSRRELFLNIEKLRTIYNKYNKYNGDIMVVLSCHSSSQGQVFSCTPTAISRTYNFEEFCSVHDFVQACQDVLKERLKVIHLSSCFAMKLNCSHKEWPVDYSWLKTSLTCILSGSAKEVYETGSQTADLFLMLNSMLSNSNLSLQYKQVLHTACYVTFPDLALEMGLCTAACDVVDSMMENPDREDQVTKPCVVNSSVHLVLICSNESLPLKDAIISNLQTRLCTDLKSQITVKNISESDNQYFLDDETTCKANEIFIVVLEERVNRITLNSLSKWLKTAQNVSVYGLHFVHVKDINVLKEMLSELNLTATGFVFEKEVMFKDLCPVLLYLIHLSLGENGSRVTSTALGCSRWTLKEVFQEVSDVLSGLSNKCNYMLLSEASVPHNTCSETMNEHVPVNSLDQNNDHTPFVKHIIECNEIDKEHLPHKNCHKLVDVLTPSIKDVPLMANVKEVLIEHYVLNLGVNFAERYIDGDILLFVKPATKEAGERKFQMCLDCTLIDIISVEEVILPDSFKLHFHNQTCCCESKGDTKDSVVCESCLFLHNFHQNKTEVFHTNLSFQKLSYATYGWCIRVWTENEASKHWPSCVHIKYRTNPNGPSLMWCTDQDGNSACFTPGAYLNNRTMMPCQEPPVAVATWQATVKVPRGFSVLSSGEAVTCMKKTKPETSVKEDVYYFEMSIPLPNSTLAFAFGKLAKSSSTLTVSTAPNSKPVTISLYAPQSKINQFEEEYLSLASKYVCYTCQLLGEYPFSRLDLVIMPRSFACMGLASPNLIFLSQSVLCGDESMSSRIAHEISHAWFGLLIGIQDWPEEWLSEGFATFLEERILAYVNKYSPQEFTMHHELLALLKLKTLDSELEVTEDDNLKLMRPKKLRRGSNNLTAIEAVDKSLENTTSDVIPHIVVPNAAVASKKWSQIHYLKGYFLLHHLAATVGYEAFDIFLKKYVDNYQGRLVTSEIFFEFFIGYFNLSSELKEQLSKDWLESPSLPFTPTCNAEENVLIKLVNEECQFWKTNNVANKRCRSRGVKRKRDVFKQRPALIANQIVLLLEKLLSIENILPQTLTQLNRVYHLDSCNAEIRHRWCELIVKHGYASKYEQVRRYLVEDQGMGIYLFGELMISENSKQRQLAEDTYGYIENEMDCSTKETVREIIYG